MNSLYVVMLQGMPEAFGERRAQLEAAFRAEIDRQFGSDERAAAALQTYIDCNLGVRGLGWPDAVGIAMKKLSGHMPPGARFDCDINWQAMTARH